MQRLNRCTWWLKLHVLEISFSLPPGVHTPASGPALLINRDSGYDAVVHCHCLRCCDNAM
jgi:hypothetical protein